MQYWAVTFVPRRSAVGLTLVVLICIGCGSSSAVDRRFAQLDHTTLATVDQPPDPCGLLTTSEINAAFDVAAKPPHPSPAATAASDIRACFWFVERPSGLFHLYAITAASHHAACVNRAVAGGASAQAADRTCPPLRLPFAGSPQFARVPNLGKEAAVHVEFTRSELDVIAGSTLLELAEVNLQPAGDTKALLVGLARGAIARLAS